MYSLVNGGAVGLDMFQGRLNRVKQEAFRLFEVTIGGDGEGGGEATPNVASHDPNVSLAG